MIANTAAPTNMPSPIARPRTFSVISALNSASSLRARSVESRSASPMRRWMLSPLWFSHAILLRRRSGHRPSRASSAPGRAARAAALALPRSSGRAGSAAAPRLRLSNVLGRALDEARREEAGEHRRDRDRARAAAHHILAELEDLIEAAFADRIGELLEAVRGAVDEAANVRAVVELARTRRAARSRDRRRLGLPRPCAGRRSSSPDPLPNRASIRGGSRPRSTAAPAIPPTSSLSALQSSGLAPAP